MTLKEFVRVLPGYCTVYVHDTGDKFAYSGSPYEFDYGVYKSVGDYIVKVAVPLKPYTMEITVLEGDK